VKPATNPYNTPDPNEFCYVKPEANVNYKHNS